MSPAFGVHRPSNSVSRRLRHLLLHPLVLRPNTAAANVVQRQGKQPQASAQCRVNSACKASSAAGKLPRRVKQTQQACANMTVG